MQDTESIATLCDGSVSLKTHLRLSSRKASIHLKIKILGICCERLVSKRRVIARFIEGGVTRGFRQI